MSETWYVTAFDEAKNPLYAGQMSVEETTVTMPAVVAALMAACDRLQAVGYDPRQVMYWRLSRKDVPAPRMSG